jgi:hypothetical protein
MCGSIGEQRRGVDRRLVGTDLAEMVGRANTSAF